MGKFRLPGLGIGVPPGVFCPEVKPPPVPSIPAEELELELELEDVLVLELTGSEKFGTCAVGEKIGHGGAETFGGVPCPLPGPVDMLLN